MDYFKIHDHAVNLIRAYGTNDPFKITKWLNVEIEYGDFKSLKGFYSYYNDIGTIALNQNLDEITSRIICAHELGHDQLHKGTGTPIFRDDDCISKEKSICEIEANFFTCELLISDEEFLELAHQGLTSSHIACVLEVHNELAILKAHSLKNRGYDLNISDMPAANYLGSI